jgi:predicted DNA-binding protein
MARRKVLTTVYLEPEQDEQLKALSERSGVPVASYIRKGIDLVLEAHKDVLPGQLPLFDPEPKKRRPKKR